MDERAARIVAFITDECEGLDGPGLLGALRERWPDLSFAEAVHSLQIALESLSARLDERLTSRGAGSRGARTRPGAQEAAVRAEARPVGDPTSGSR